MTGNRNAAHPSERIKAKYRNPNHVPPDIRSLPSNHRENSRPVSYATTVPSNFGPLAAPVSFNGTNYVPSPSPYPFSIPQISSPPIYNTGVARNNTTAGFPTIVHSSVRSSRSSRPPAQEYEPPPAFYTLPSQSVPLVDRLSEAGVRLEMDNIQHLPDRDSSSKVQHLQALAQRLRYLNEQDRRLAR